MEIFFQQWCTKNSVHVILCIESIFSKGGVDFPRTKKFNPTLYIVIVVDLLINELELFITPRKLRGLDDDNVQRENDNK